MTKLDLDNYITVQERIAMFYGEHPAGSLQSEIIFDDGKRVVMKSYAYRSPTDQTPAVGHAEEVRGAGPINKTNALENCETSSIGRALAMLGLEVIRGIASRDDMERAQQEEARQESLITGEQVALLRDHYDAAAAEGLDVERAKAKLGSMGIDKASNLMEALASMTPPQAAEFDAWMAEEAAGANSAVPA